jgi:hypothetical protein
MLGKLASDRVWAGGGAGRLQQVPEEFLDRDADGVGGGFRRIANLPVIFPQMGSDLFEFFLRLRFGGLGLGWIVEGLFEFPRSRIVGSAGFVIVGGEGGLVDWFRGSRGGVIAGGRVIDFYAATPLGLGRRVLGGQIQFLEPLSWMAERFSDVANALFVSQNRFLAVKCEMPKRALPPQRIARLAASLNLGSCGLAGFGGGTDADADVAAPRIALDGDLERACRARQLKRRRLVCR